MATTILGVSLLYGEFKAVALRHGAVSGAWRCPDPVETLEEIRAALHGAIRATGFKGDRVSMMYEGERMVHQFYQTPPMNRRDLTQFIRRKARAEKPFDDEPVFSHSLANSPKGSALINLNLAPHGFVDGLVALCQEMGLYLVHLSPLAPVMAEQFAGLPLAAGHIGAFIGEGAGKMELVIGAGKGKLLFIRALGALLDSDEGVERVGREINRSLLFAKQQFGAVIEQIWVMEDLPPERLERLQTLAAVAIRPAPALPGEYHWIGTLLSLSPNHEGNLIPREAREKPRQKALLRLAMAGVAAVWVVSLGCVAYIETIIMERQRVMNLVSPRLMALEDRRDEWRTRYEETEYWRRISQITRDERLPPMAGWFLGYLGEVTPDNLALTAVIVRREGDAWTVQLDGMARGGLVASAEGLKAFENALVAGPFRFTPSKGWRDGWETRLRSGAAEGTHPFTIEGRI